MRISDWSSDVCSSDLTSQWGITTASAQGRRYAMGDTTDGWRPAAPWGTMALFLSTYVNRIDKKGRVSVPATFRAALEASGSPILYVTPHHELQAIDGNSQAWMEQLVARMDEQIGRAHVCTPVTNAQPVCRLLLEKK